MIWIDYREASIISTFQDNLSEKDFSCLVKICNLPIGDIVFTQESNASIETTPSLHDIIFIIERKTVSDLVSSIRDGRYEEQSFRLNDLPLHNHHILYLIEGDIEKHLPTQPYSKHKITKETILASFTSLLLFKGFSLYHSQSASHSVEYILAMHQKILKNLLSHKQFFYFHPQSDHFAINNQKPEYHSVLKKKQVYADEATVHIGMLCQIPSISSTIASALMNDYKTVPNLISKLMEQENLLDTWIYTSKSDKKRKLTKPMIKNLTSFLIHKE